MSRAAGHTHSSARDPGLRARQQKGLAIDLALTAGYMIAEIIGGLLTNSLALLADAGHMLSDVAALALSLFAMWVARRPATPQRTYGCYRTEILGANAPSAAGTLSGARPLRK
ncbi:MAG: cation diffusion facilitator family transporter [Gemmatimonadota bacterium]